MPAQPEVIPATCGQCRYFSRTSVVRGRCRFYNTVRYASAACLASEPGQPVERPVQSEAPAAREEREAPRVYPCPQCRETVNTLLTQCPFCSAALDRERGLREADIQEKVNQALDDAGALFGSLARDWPPPAVILGVLLSGGLAMITPLWALAWIGAAAGFVLALSGLPWAWLWLALPWALLGLGRAVSWRVRFGSIPSPDPLYAAARRSAAEALLLFLPPLVIGLAGIAAFVRDLVRVLQEG